MDFNKLSQTQPKTAHRGLSRAAESRMGADTQTVTVIKDGEKSVETLNPPVEEKIEPATPVATMEQVKTEEKKLQDVVGILKGSVEKDNTAKSRCLYIKDRHWQQLQKLTKETGAKSVSELLGKLLDQIF